jgi:hypothetical protein
MCRQGVKLPNIEEYLRGALTRTVTYKFKQYCGDNAESMLKATTPHDTAAFSNNFLLHEAELWCPFWMSCLRGACNPAKTLKNKYKFDGFEYGNCCKMSQPYYVSCCLLFIQ